MSVCLCLSLSLPISLSLSPIPAHSLIPCIHSPFFSSPKLVLPHSILFPLTLLRHKLLLYIHHLSFHSQEKSVRDYVCAFWNFSKVSVIIYYADHMQSAVTSFTFLVPHAVMIVGVGPLRVWQW